MATTHQHFHLELRHATAPTYFISYLFPALLFVGLQIAVEAIFLLGAAMRRDNRDFEHRLPNVILGIGCSIAILALDLAIQLSF